MATLTLKLHVAWWLNPYLCGVAFMSAVTCCEPDMERVEYWVRKACRFEIVK